jgi:hypothetical protein
LGGPVTPIQLICEKGVICLEKAVKGPTRLQAIEVNIFALWLTSFRDNGRCQTERMEVRSSCVD